MDIHVCFSVSEECIEPQASAYGTCIGCNACGRINKATQTHDAIDMYKRHLGERENFSDWWEGFEELQRKNIKSDIEYFKKKISDLQNER